MPGTAKDETHKEILHREDDRNLQSKKQKLKPRNKVDSSLSKRKLSIREHNRNGKLKKRIVDKAIVRKTKTSKRKPSFRNQNDKPSKINKKEGEKPGDGDDKSQNIKRRRRKKRTNYVEIDEASRLQRRTRYLLVKMKLEQNLIDAYSGEGWKGQSREKIKPEKELLRAKRQILKCKLGIREAIHQLHLLSSVGCINESAVALDGSVHHEHIICAKCKLREALPDNDIILCDGTCNCAFHQNCLDPPLQTENIPPGDEGWFCKFCKKKMEILEATNAHLGTQFPMDSKWQDIFKEEAALPDGGNSLLRPEDEWPSDDSEDDDYDPERIEHSSSYSSSRSESDASAYSLGSAEDETLLTPGRVEEGCKRSFDDSLYSDEINDGEVLCRPRQRASVDYIQLYNEMFGKNANENEEISDDEDWGPSIKKRKIKDTDAACTLITLGENEETITEDGPSQIKEIILEEKTKRPIFRLPHNAVEKLRLVFAENELPPRAVRESLSKQLGLDFEKVNKWFKNARYLALKARKTNGSQDVGPSFQKEAISETSTDDQAPHIMSKDNTSQSLKNLEKVIRRKDIHKKADSPKIKQPRKVRFQAAGNSKAIVDFVDDDVSLKLLKEKAKEAKKKSHIESRRDKLKEEAEAEMKRLCRIKIRVEKLQEILRELPTWRFGKAREINVSDPPILFVPEAEVKEKS